MQSLQPAMPSTASSPCPGIEVVDIVEAGQTEQIIARYRYPCVP